MYTIKLLAFIDMTYTYALTHEMVVQVFIFYHLYGCGNHVQVMVASHNQQSIELAIQTMSTFSIPPSSSVYFGQLLGMADNLTFILGQHGYKAYKYVPYGKVASVSLLQSVSIP